MSEETVNKVMIFDYLVAKGLIKYESWSYCQIVERVLTFPTNYITLDEKTGKVAEEIFKNKKV